MQTQFSEQKYDMKVSINTEDGGFISFSDASLGKVIITFQFYENGVVFYKDIVMEGKTLVKAVKAVTGK